MSWSLSVVLIVPAHLQERANRLSCALGYDDLPGNTFSVPLSGDGQEPVTHYGCRTIAEQEFMNIRASAVDGDLPDLPWDDFGVVAQDIAGVLTGQIVDARPASDAGGHFDAVLRANALSRVEPAGV